MAKKIDLTKPLSEFDRQYLLARNRLAEVRANDEEFGETEETPKPTGDVEPEVAPEQMSDDDLIEWAEEKTVKDLQATLKERGVEVPSKANKDELVNLLLADVEHKKSEQS